MSEQLYTTIAEELAKGNSVTCFTVGISMRPLLRERQTHVTLAPPSSFRRGDILLYKRANGQLVLHRLIRRRGDICLIRGDNTYGLEKVPADRVIGVVTHIYRRGRLFAVENRLYSAYVALWCLCYPLRWLLWRLRTLLWRMARILKKKGKHEV